MKLFSINTILSRRSLIIKIKLKKRDTQIRTTFNSEKIQRLDLFIVIDTQFVSGSFFNGNHFKWKDDYYISTKS